MNSDQKHMRDKLENGMNAARDRAAGSPKSRAETTLMRSVTESERGGEGDNVRDHKGNRFFFYKKASVVRLPIIADQNTNVRVQRDRPDDADIALDAHTFGLEEGFYVLKDGTVVMLMPQDGRKIDVVVQGKPADPSAVADDGYNYKC